MISAEMPYKKSFVEIGEYKIAHTDIGEGDPIVFLHGNATSPYMWRNIMPHLEGAPQSPPAARRRPEG